VMTANLTWRRSDPFTDTLFFDRLALIIGSAAPSAFLLSGGSSFISAVISRVNSVVDLSQLPQSCLILDVRPMVLHERQRTVVYALVLTVQIVAAVAFVCSQFPTFSQLAFNPGKQIPDRPLHNLATAGNLLVMQGAYWYGQRIPVPFLRPNSILHHVLLFLGRLSFFGAAALSFLFFRHLLELRSAIDVFVASQRGLLVIVSLFSLFCFSLALEQLGNAFGDKRPA